MTDEPQSPTQGFDLPDVPEQYPQSRAVVEAIRAVHGTDSEVITEIVKAFIAAIVGLEARVVVLESPGTHQSPGGP
jgi:hypothetical protein